MFSYHTDRTAIAFEWRRMDTREISPSAIITSDGTLIIPRLELRDIALYRCQTLLDQNEIAFIERGVIVFGESHPLNDVMMM